MAAAQHEEPSALACPVCFRHCRLREGQRGFCGARVCRGGQILPDSYGKLTALALDPIEKKPLARFHPGSRVVSLGSYGCSMNCPFCQNSEISRKTEDSGTTYVSPEELCRIVVRAHERDPGTIGAAYTYNEPMTFYEYIRDAAKLIHERGLLNVVVTSGTAEPAILEQILPYIDAFNVDLKAYREDTYRDVLGGSLEETKEYIRLAATRAHVEVTTLIVPGINDREEEIREIASFVRSVDGRGDIPLHLSRFFPRYRMSGAGVEPTDVRFIYRMRDVAREYLHYVYTGNC